MRPQVTNIWDWFESGFAHPAVVFNRFDLVPPVIHSDLVAGLEFLAWDGGAVAAHGVGQFSSMSSSIDAR